MLLSYCLSCTEKSQIAQNSYLQVWWYDLHKVNVLKFISNYSYWINVFLDVTSGCNVHSYQNIDITFYLNFLSVYMLSAWVPKESTEEKCNYIIFYSIKNNLSFFTDKHVCFNMRRDSDSFFHYFNMKIAKLFSFFFCKFIYLWQQKLEV